MFYWDRNQNRSGILTGSVDLGGRMGISDTVHLCETQYNHRQNWR